MAGISARERRLLILTVVAIVIAVPTILLPLLAGDEAVERNSEASLENVEKVLGRVESQLRSNLKLRARTGNAEAQFIPRARILDLVVMLEQAGGESGLKISSFAPSRREKAKPLEEVNVQLNYTGRYPNVVQFLDKLEHLKIPVFVRNLRMTLKDENSGELSGSIKITSYILEPPKLIGQKKDEESEASA